MVTLGFGAIGFYDDYLKVTKQSHLGLSGRTRLAIEFVIARDRRLHHHATPARRRSPRR